MELFSRDTFTFRTFLVANIAFFTFAGYYVINATAIEVGFASATRFFTVPLRLYICALSAVFLLLAMKNIRISGRILFLFCWFWSLYLYRIIDSAYTEPQLLTRSGNEFLLFSFSFGIMPFLYFSSLSSLKDWYLTKQAIVLGSLALSMIAIFFYREYLGSEFGRVVGIRADDHKTIGPLALSYSATILIGISGYDFFMEDKGKRIRNLLLVLIAGFPFVLGSSRGSVVAIGACFVFVMFARGSIRQAAKVLIAVLALSPIAFNLIESSGSDIYERMGTILIQLEPEETKNTWNRIYIWKTSLEQFYENPWFGDFLENRARGHHPHNIIIESLMTTGVIGTIPFVTLILISIVRSIMIIRFRPEFGWMVVVFVQVLTMNMFSGGIFGAIWFWSSMGMILSVRIRNEGFN